MSKKFDLYCDNHGRIKLEIERPTKSAIMNCPICHRNLRVPSDEKVSKLQSDYSLKGVAA